MENYLDNYFGGNPVKEINKICDDLISFAYSTVDVVACKACKNKKDCVCQETNGK